MRWRQLLEPAAESRLLQPGGFALIQVHPAFWDRAKRIITAARATASTIPDVFEAEQSRFALRDALLKVAHDLVSPEPDVKICMPRSRPGAAANCAASGRVYSHPPGPTNLL